jgi:hypothetical protein
MENETKQETPPEPTREQVLQELSEKYAKTKALLKNQKGRENRSLVLGLMSILMTWPDVGARLLASANMTIDSDVPGYDDVRFTLDWISELDERLK